MLYDVSLANRDCIFDEASGLCFEDALSFASGRGGVYVVHILHHGATEAGVSLGYDSDTDTFKAQDMWGEWTVVNAEQIRTMLSGQ